MTSLKTLMTPLGEYVITYQAFFAVWYTFSCAYANFIALIKSKRICTALLMVHDSWNGNWNFLDMKTRVMCKGIIFSSLIKLLSYGVCSIHTLISVMCWNKLIPIICEWSKIILSFSFSEDESFRSLYFNFLCIIVFKRNVI